MTNKPLISVIIPIYNSDKYLARCIDSICKQTYTNLEIILVNDGSTDNSINICKESANKDKRISIFDIPNGGVSNARNTGLKNASGEYIQFIDSDDYVSNNYIESLFNSLTSTNSGLVVCAIESYDNQNIKFDEWRVPENVLDFETINRDLFLELIEKFLLFGPVNKLYRTEIISQNSIFFDPSLSYGEDLIFNFDYFKYIKSIAINSDVTYKYIHDNTESLSKKHYSNKTELANRIHFTLIDFFNNNGLTDNKSISVLYNRLFDYYYNETFKITSSRGLTLNEKYNKVKNILRDQELIKSYKYIEATKYSKWIIFCMKNKLVLPFLLVDLIKKK